MLPDGTVADGKAETYDHCIETICSTLETFFTSVVSAQNRRRPLASYGKRDQEPARGIFEDRFTVESGVKVFFADPHSPWQRGTNENTNGLLRQYFPKGTDLSRWSAREIQAVANALNTRPRETLGWKTPAEALDEYLKSVQQSGVATTG
ncbi:hypothetical protein LMG29542_08323 [Paraburkholderia humisilvae]|uniref:Integrase catalytic domain-containing protein n=1 Tax=Paraburkholderia humisilvae TaxID=627669 RepID=A0A6J5FAW2_9BURK|nr:hypothetical protein LMG29542_08323 [Paraburkholderia humisilvae]